VSSRPVLDERTVPSQKCVAMERWGHVRRVLVIRLDNIGDVIMLGPALRAIRANLPTATITLMATPGGSQALPLLPWVDDVMVHRVLWQDISGTWPLDPATELALVDEIRARNFDAAIIFTSFTQSPYPPAYVCYLAGVPLRIAQSKEFGGGAVTEWVRPLSDDTHQVDRNLHLLASAGFGLAGTHLELRIPESAQSKADELLGSVGLAHGGPRDRFAPFIALAPGASAVARRYDPARFARVASSLAAQDHPLTGEPLTVVLVGSEREADLVAPMLDGSSLCEGRLVSLAGKTTVPELAGIINRAALVIANNSAPLHMADALDRPMVIMYAGTEWESQWRPRSAPATLLRRETDCSPCFAFRCPYNMECLDFEPADVVAEALRMLTKTYRVLPVSQDVDIRVSC
jgi:ADP-heptose:LPS heptosyltransferase